VADKPPKPGSYAALMRRVRTGRVAASELPNEPPPPGKPSGGYVGVEIIPTPPEGPGVGSAPQPEKPPDPRVPKTYPGMRDVLKSMSDPPKNEGPIQWIDPDHDERTGPARETAVVSEDSAVADRTQAADERSFNVALAAYAAVFGAGVLQLAARDWYFGPIFTLGGGLGLMSIHPLIRPKFRIMRSNRSLWAVVTVTWLFLAANVGFAVYDHFWTRPFTIGVSPIEGQAAPEQPPARVYTTKTVEQLAAFYEGRTILQGDILMTPERGKWINAEGKIQTLMSNGIVFFFQNEHPVQCQFSEKWKPRLGLFQPFETIKVTGRISPAAGSTLILQECELRD
jgi:hypothetical protein